MMREGIPKKRASMLKTTKATRAVLILGWGGD